MWKALIKLQLQSYIGALSRNTKTGKRHSPLVLIGIAVLGVYLVAVFAGMFFSLGYLLAEPFTQMGILWFYFMIGGILATLLGVFGSVFFAKSYITAPVVFLWSVIGKTFFCFAYGIADWYIFRKKSS